MIRLSGSAIGLNHALIAAAALFTALAIWPWIAPLPAPTGSIAPPNQPAKPQLAPSFPPLANFVAIGARPLFSPTRRPARTDAAAPAAAGVSDRYGLIGIVTSETTRHAWLAEGTRHFEVSEGETLDGWRVLRIEPSRILLSSPQGEVAVLTMRRPTDEKPAK